MSNSCSNGCPGCNQPGKFRLMFYKVYNVNNSRRGIWRHIYECNCESHIYAKHDGTEGKAPAYIWLPRLTDQIGNKR